MMRRFSGGNVSRRRRIAVALWVVCAFGTSNAMAQGGPRVSPTPAAGTVNGQPNIGGFWTGQGGSYDIEIGPDPRHDLTAGREPRPYTSMIVDPSDSRIPYQPWAMVVKKDHFDNHGDPKTPEHVDGVALCHLAGIPRQMYHAGNWQILQPKGYVVFLLESTHAYRVVPLRDDWLLPEDAGPLWMGDSRGRWEGNTLIIETRNLDARPRFDAVGNFHSADLRVTEYITLVDADTIRYRATMTDPKVYLRPWTMEAIRTRNREPGFELIEDACHEGNRFHELVPAANAPSTTPAR